MTNQELQAIANHFVTWNRVEQAQVFNGIIAPEYVSCDAENRAVELCFETKPWMSNPAGGTHGGMTSAMFDTAFGLTTRCFLPEGTRFTTVKLDVTYLHVIPLGARLHIRTKVVHVGRRLASSTAEAWLEDNPEKIFAFSSTTHCIL